MIEERLNYISILSIENDITISLYYEEAIKEYAAKNVEKNVLWNCVSKVIKKYGVNILDFVTSVIFVSLFKFVIYSDFSF